MANNKFKAAVKKAKGLYKSGKYKTFGDAVKAAYKKVKVGSRGNDSSRGAGHTSTATKAYTSGNRTATKTITANVKIGSRKKGMNVTKAKGFIRSEYKEQLAALLVRNELLPSKGNKTKKKKLRKSITEKKRQLNKLD